MFRIVVRGEERENFEVESESRSGSFLLALLFRLLACLWKEKLVVVGLDTLEKSLSTHLNSFVPPLPPSTSHRSPPLPCPPSSHHAPRRTRTPSECAVLTPSSPRRLPSRPPPSFTPSTPSPLSSRLSLSSTSYLYASVQAVLKLNTQEGTRRYRGFRSKSSK
jgi:hypothetical protein